MAGEITGLRFQQHTSDRVNVFIDGEFAFGLPALTAASLHVGQYLSDSDIEALQVNDAGQKAYDRAVRFLEYRPRSEAEVRGYLRKAALAPDVIEVVIARLTDQGYLNDAEFAHFWVQNRQRFRPRSPYALRQELRQKGVSDATIAEATAEVDPVAAAYSAGHPRALKLAELAATDPAAFRKRLGDFLLRRGFGYEITGEVVKLLFAEVIGDIEALEGSEESDS